MTQMSNGGSEDQHLDYPYGPRDLDDLDDDRNDDPWTEPPYDDDYPDDIDYDPDYDGYEYDDYDQYECSFMFDIQEDD